MATPPGNNPQQGTGPSQAQAQDQLAALKSVLKLQGDYRDVLKDSVRELDKTLKTYDKMEAKLASITRSSINIKDIEKEMKTVREQQYLNGKKMADLEKSLSESQKKATQSYLEALQKRDQTEKDLLKAQKTGAVGQIKHFENMIAAAEKRLQNEEALLNVDQLSYAQAIKSDELNQEILNKQQAQLDFEEKLRKQVGFTGAAFKFLAEKIGVGESFQEDMVESARKLNEEGKKFTFGNKIAALGRASLGALTEVFKDPLAFAAAWKAVSAGFDKLGGAAASVGKGVAGLSDESSTVFSGMASSVSGLLKNIPLVGGLLGGLVEGFASIFDLIVGVENTTIKAGRELGMSRNEAMAMHHEFAAISEANGDIFVTSTKLLETQVELSKTLGVNNRLTQEQLSTSIKLKDLAGLENDTIAKFAEVSKISGKSQEGVVKSVLAQVQGLKKATGISFNQKEILKETANMSGVLGLQFAKYPEKLTKSLLTTKALGMELKDIDGLADSFLDFESSIANEMEAQLLTGKDINLSKARELFLTNDLAGAALEINKQVGSSSDFLKMNRIQAESMAKAFGMSRDQMADMLKKQEFLGKLGAKETDNAREQLRLGLEKYGSQKALNAALGDQAYQSLVTASTQEKMAALIDKIKTSIVDFISRSGIMEKIQGFMDYLTKPSNVRAIINTVKNFLADAVAFIGGAIAALLNALDYVAFGQIPNSLIESIESGSERMAASIRGAGGGAHGETPSIGDKAAGGTVAATSTPAAATTQTSNKGFKPAPTVIQNNNTITITGQYTKESSEQHVINDKSPVH